MKVTTPVPCFGGPLGGQWIPVGAIRADDDVFTIGITKYSRCYANLRGKSKNHHPAAPPVLWFYVSEGYQNVINGREILIAYGFEFRSVP